MKLRNRFLLIGTGAVLFCLVTPFLVLYAQGYKIDFATRKLLKTGSLVAKTEPTKAVLELNGKIQPKSETPATVRFLLPGDYDVTLKKDGYQPWTKRLSIKSELVTWTNFEREFVTLFYQTPKQIFSENPDYAAGYRADNQILLIKQGKLFSIKPDQTEVRQVRDLTDLAPFYPSISLSKENIYELLKNSIKLTAEQLSQLGRIESNSNYVALSLGQSLYYKLQNNQEIVSVSPNSQAFTLFGNELWYLQGGSLIRYNLKLGLSENVKTGVPVSANSQIIRTNDHVFVTTDKVLYSINGDITKIYEGVDFAEWSDPAQVLVFANKYEVMVYRPLKLQTELIVRSSTPIEQPLLNSTTGYLFFNNENKIKAIEMDGRDHRNIYTIVEAPHSRFLMNPEGTKLLVYTANQVQIYEIR